MFDEEFTSWNVAMPSLMRNQLPTYKPHRAGEGRILKEKRRAIFGLAACSPLKDLI